MENTENTTSIHNNCYSSSEEATGNVSHHFEEQENITLQVQHELKSAASQTIYSSSEPQKNQEEELSAVDLTVTRPHRRSNSFSIEYGTSKDDTSMGHFSKNVNSSDLNPVIISSDVHMENPIENSNYMSNLGSYRNDFNQVSHYHCTSNQTIHPQKRYTFKRVSNGPNCTNAETEVDFVLLVDQETQTQTKKFKEASVQTGKDTNKCTYSLFKKNSLSNLNYSCLVCQRFYTSKSSYDRHARTHIKNRNIITNLHMTKKAKFTIFEENICRRQPLKGVPMILHESKLTEFQCGICCKSFSSQGARDVHRNNFVLQEFPMTKCKECHLKFFTVGALLEHVNIVHNINTYNCNVYCCIFCNESFRSSYSFQLHLDEHLSTQLNI